MLLIITLQVTRDSIPYSFTLISLIIFKKKKKTKKRRRNFVRLKIEKTQFS